MVLGQMDFRHPLVWWMSFTMCGDVTVRIHPYMSLSDSFARTVEAAMVLKQEGHPEATGCSFFDL